MSKLWDKAVKYYLTHDDIETFLLVCIWFILVWMMFHAFNGVMACEDILLMNRFLIDHHPDAIAKAMCDKHIVKMPTEEAQMLSHVLHHYLGEEGETMKEFTAELGLCHHPHMQAPLH